MNDSTSVTTTNPREWFRFAKDVYVLLSKEMEDALKSSDLPLMYPKLVVGYEFFRLVRGEAFHAQRPAGLGDHQKEIYRMEEKMWEKLGECRSRLDPADDRTKFHLDEMKKSFALDKKA